MAGNIQILKDAIKAARNEVKLYDGESPGQTQADAINKEAEVLAVGIDNYIKSITFAATQADVTNAAMVAGGYPVAAANILIVKTTEL